VARAQQAAGQQQQQQRHGSIRTGIYQRASDDEDSDFGDD
jgi:hypothetical protein